MQREVTAIVLCILAQAASAQCVATPVVPVAHTAPAVKGNAPAQNAAARPGGELIKAAAAGTRDDAPPSARDSVSARGGAQGDEELHLAGQQQHLHQQLVQQPFSLMFSVRL